MGNKILKTTEIFDKIEHLKNRGHPWIGNSEEKSPGESPGVRRQVQQLNSAHNRFQIDLKLSHPQYIDVLYYTDNTSVHRDTLWQFQQSGAGDDDTALKHYMNSGATLNLDPQAVCI